MPFYLAGNAMMAIKVNGDAAPTTARWPRCQEHRGRTSDRVSRLVIALSESNEVVDTTSGRALP